MSVAAPAVAAADRAPGAGAGPSAAVTTPFTVGLSASTVQPGGQLVVSGQASARAGLAITIVSPVIASGRMVDGAPAVTTPALVEGIYQKTVRISREAQPGVYSVWVRFGGREVAHLDTLRVVAAGSRTGGTASRTACAGIGFTVLHDDWAGGVALRGGAYRITSPNLDCGTASADLGTLLKAARAGTPGWTGRVTTSGRATFAQASTGLRFTVTRTGASR